MMSFLGLVLRNSENIFLKNRTLPSAILWNEGAYFSKKVEIPIPPKRPLTAYMLFVKEKRQELLKETPVLSNQDQIKLLAKRWTNLTADSKKPYELQARESTLLYGERHKRYYENLSEQQREELNKQKSEKRMARRVYRLNKALRESSFPKHARSAYALFVHSLANNDKNENSKKRDLVPRRLMLYKYINIIAVDMSKYLGMRSHWSAKYRSDSSLKKDFLKHAAEKWKILPENEKKSFEKQAADDKERYLLEIAGWKEKLLKEGNSKLLKEFSELKYGGKSLMNKTDEAEGKKGTKTKSRKKEKSSSQ